MALPQITQTPTGPAKHAYLRVRLSELKSMMDLLSQERQLLQAESDAITYPVLSLPPEITMKIFHHCIPSKSKPSASPANPPLLLTEICHQWRQIAITTPHLWQSLAFGEESSVEMLELWLSRAGSLPLNCSLKSTAKGVIEAALLHSNQWEDVSLVIPVRYLAKLDLHQHHFPALRNLSLGITPKRANRSIALPDAVVFPHCPSLLAASIHTLPHLKFDIPGHQLTSLALSSRVDLAECISYLRASPRLVHLVLSIGSPGAAVDTVPHLTMAQLVTLTSDSRTILEYLTLPRLEQLAVHRCYADPTIVESCLRRSACPLNYLFMDMATGQVAPLRACLHATPNSLTEMEIRWCGIRPGLGELLKILGRNVLPRLAVLQYRDSWLSHKDYERLLTLVRRRREPMPGRVVLRAFTIHLESCCPVDEARSMPLTSTMAEFRTLVGQGLTFKFIVSVTHGVRQETRSVFDSTAA
ncbi:hypothetical protein C8R47DRAFT_1159114 [Mycena vitilis]|nr:hypothetical protein C8R47DRAFT_1159114 [Mycena vitilis]